MEEKKNLWSSYDEAAKKELHEINEKYKACLDAGKTERECVKLAVEMAKEAGYQDIKDVLKEGKSLKAGDKVYYINRDKSMYLAIIGQNPIENGINIIGSHADSPRLDLKPNPIYEDKGFVYFKTHYYGGIKKYQWTTIPLSIHGVIAKTNGEKIEVNIGESDEDPIFTITDLLPHLAQEQMQKKLKDGVEGENLNLLIGSIPYNDEKVSEKVKLNILNILNRKYGIVEKDFLSAELELVPAFKCRSLGFDESLIAGYGQDDKVSVYTSLTAILNIENPTKTAACLFVDKEEIGSMGNTGMESNVFSTFMSDVLNKLGVNRPNLLDKMFCNSRMLSADVDAGLDPIYASVADLHNASFLNKGVGISKYTGVAGKANGSDANAEFVSQIMSLFEKNNVDFQIGTLGKIGKGGGGTIAYILANKGVDVIDCGTPVLAMHSPFEVASIYDIYATYLAYKTMFRGK